MKRAKKALLPGSLATELESVWTFVCVLQLLCIEAGAVQLSSIATETKTVHPRAGKKIKINQACKSAARPRLVFSLPIRWYSGQWHSYCLQFPDLLFRFYLPRDPEPGLNITPCNVLFFSKRKLSHDVRTVRASGQRRGPLTWEWVSVAVAAQNDKTPLQIGGGTSFLSKKLWLLSQYGCSVCFSAQDFSSLHRRKRHECQNTPHLQVLFAW